MPPNTATSELVNIIMQPMDLTAGQAADVRDRLAGVIVALLSSVHAIARAELLAAMEAHMPGYEDADKHARTIAAGVMRSHLDAYHAHDAENEITRHRPEGGIR